ncbi:MAG: 16S rRNA (guanine(527)-N(7))-methyltransferase RsmG [Desulfobulbus propionicus]|nr:MAG: 16S rRNA (guanine(527)-N(7))-methyltransferase RsmG [Desulfobulbus propionicus]
MTDAEQLRQGARALGVELDGAAVDRLLVFTAELLKWNRRFNLVARGTSAGQLLDRHVLDSLALLPLLGGEDRLLDVGSGAGFPGLVLAAAQPEMETVLVEPRQKRTSFLSYVIRLLGLQRVRVVAGRLEAWNAPFTPTVITGRAVTGPAEFLELIRCRLGLSSRVILMAASDEGLASLAVNAGFARTTVHHYRLPGCGAPRVLAELTP